MIHSHATLRTHKEASAAWLFFKRWLANPLSMASITPSAPSLSRLMAAQITRGPDEVVVEFGGGTGAVTRAILEAGVPADKLFTVERDSELAGYLRRHFPGIHVLEGDVADIRSMLPEDVRGKVGTVLVCLPMILIPVEDQRAIVDAIFEVMPPGRAFYAYTYSARSPIRRKALGLKGRRVGFTIANIPPASVWRFVRDGA
ncbi:phospholipid methyltransferase [Niveispirillum lacus]|uniref:Phospholipid methyltransferase n=1 Tax=Niveispirillum lacus TaxID=1981099 RepID=A0A255Z2X4_9PROT|nr:phospholipid methyltransferase [Niveispirillum lacus]OYQ35802.1 phospholipid methyltransferase [Niveispirillum lacus]